MRSIRNVFVVRVSALMMCCIALGTALPAAAQSTTSPSPPAAVSPIDIAKARIDTMLRTGHADPAWFSDSFLAQIPATGVDAVIANVEAQVGIYQSVEYTPDAFVAHFSKGTDNVLIHLDADNKIDGLLFKPPTAAGTN